MIKRIPIEHLDMGMFVVALDRPWLYTPFLFHKFMIKTQAQIDNLKNYGIKTLDIDISLGKDHIEAVPIEIAEEKLNQEFIIEAQKLVSEKMVFEVPYEQEVLQAKNIYRELRKTLEYTINEVRLGKVIQMENVHRSVEKTIDSLQRNRHASLILTRLKSFDQYTFVHSVNVAILAISLGIQLKFAKEDLQYLGTGGLLHDIGKIKIPDKLLNKPGRLTDAEHNQIKKHVQYGLQILSKAENFPSSSLTMVYEHHERYDGSGYPRGLKEDELHVYGGIAGIVDVFDALTTRRPYRKELLPNEALREMFKMKKAFPPLLLEQFIQCLGIYPVGSLVELNTQETALVIENNPRDLVRPVVKVVFDKKGYRYAYPKILDLTESKDEQTGFVKEIVRSVHPSSLGLNPDMYIYSMIE